MHKSDQGTKGFFYYGMLMTMIMCKKTTIPGLALLLVFTAAGATGDKKSLVVDKVEDGDTIVVMLDGQLARLQLIGIDAPEDTVNAKLKRDYKATKLNLQALRTLGLDATRHLQSLVARGDVLQVTGRFDQRDRYGRILVMAIDSAGRSLGETMVKDGYAVLNTYGAVEEELKIRLETLESEAVAYGRGLWGASRKATMAWSGRKN